MGLYSIWQEKTDDSVLGAERVNAYIREYFGKEKDAYAAILAARENRIEGTVGELAEKFGLEPFEVTAFIDGINTSLNSQIEVEPLEADSNVVLDIDWKKLYYNMNKAKAPWLYELEEWDGILDADERIAIRTQYRKDVQAVSTKVGRNDPCPCGSGKKYKKCCGRNEE
ncbi:MAG: SEC-C domain-containing protein [Clostridia bacterium]|nr:SEC-C domain-containing protein [Clostridia bacterium]MBP5766036.1 SEC-C domain-containing protein [Clostridia bacterium]